MPYLILNETTLFYLDLNTMNQSKLTFGKISNWTSQVAKANQTKSKAPCLVSTATSTTAVATSQITASNAAVVVKPQMKKIKPQAKKVKPEPQEINLMTIGILEEDKAVEHDVALSSTIKGGQRLSSMVHFLLLYYNITNLLTGHCQG